MLKQVFVGYGVLTHILRLLLDADVEKLHDQVVDGLMKHAACESCNEMQCRCSPGQPASLLAAYDTEVLKLAHETPHTACDEHAGAQGFDSERNLARQTPHSPAPRDSDGAMAEGTPHSLSDGAMAEAVSFCPDTESSHTSDGSVHIDITSEASMEMTLLSPTEEGTSVLSASDAAISAGQL